jgi:hypothetical protein
VALIWGASAQAVELTLPPPPPPPAVVGFQTFGGGLPLAQFLKITLGDIARRSYVLAPDAAAASQPISADFTYSKIKDPLPLVREILAGQGLGLRDVGGVLLVEKLVLEKKTDKKQGEETLIYAPKNQGVGALSTYFSLFPELQFSFTKGLTLPAHGAPGAPVAEGSGGATFSATNQDPGLLVARGAGADLAKFEQFLAKIDIAAAEVLIRAFVLEVRSTKSDNSGVSLVAELLGGQIALNAGGQVVGGLQLKAGGLQLAIANVLADSRVKLVSSPVLRAADGTTASASIGTETPTLGAIVSQNGSTQQSISYQSAGVILSISPKIYADSIRLAINQELSSFAKTDTGLDTTPTKLRRSFKSDLIAKNSEILLLGGLAEQQSSETNSKNFGWFGSSSATESNSQIVVLLQAERI